MNHRHCTADKNFTKISNFAGKVQNIHAYMLTALYNEPASHHLGIHNETTYLKMELES